MGNKVKFTGIDNPSEEVDTDHVTGVYDAGRHREIELGKLGKNTEGRQKGEPIRVRVTESMEQINAALAAPAPKGKGKGEAAAA